MFLAFYLVFVVLYFVNSFTPILLEVGRENLILCGCVYPKFLMTDLRLMGSVEVSGAQ